MSVTRAMSRASNSRVNPESGRAQGTATWRTPWAGQLTRGTRACRYAWCWKKSRCRHVLADVSWTAQASSSPSGHGKPGPPGEVEVQVEAVAGGVEVHGRDRPRVLQSQRGLEQVQVVHDGPPHLSVAGEGPSLCLSGLPATHSIQRGANNVNSRRINHSGPTWSGDAWIARGWNSVSGAKLTVEVYCVSPNDVPGFDRIELDYGGNSYWKTSITCPQGKRILNGGTERHFGYANTFASYPSITTWTATGYHATGSTYLRAWCVSAGTPTVEITGATPGPEGAVTAQTYASFSFTGTDPAGYPNGFKCSQIGR